MVRRNCIAFLAIAMLSTLSATQAEQLIIENIDSTASALSERPNRGMSMQTVEAKWGQPSMAQGAVGDPPITRWEYPGFVVYFEHSNVIHSVIKR